MSAANPNVYGAMKSGCRGSLHDGQDARVPRSAKMKPYFVRLAQDYARAASLRPTKPIGAAGPLLPLGSELRGRRQALAPTIHKVAFPTPFLIVVSSTS